MGVIRSREKTKARILEAVGKLLEHSGFRSLGINNIAREAGVDKVLIYRYFGGLPQLYSAFAEECDFWPSIEELVFTAKEFNGKSAEDTFALLLKGYLHGLRKRNMAQELLRGELECRNDLAGTTAELRSEQGKRIVSMIDGGSGISGNIDVTAAAALLSAGFTYLLLRAKTSGRYLGMDLNSEEAWKRIEETLDVLARGFFCADAGQT